MFPVKKIIVDFDVPYASVYKHSRQYYNLNEERYFPYFAGELQTLIPRDINAKVNEDFFKDNLLFNDQGLSKLILPIGGNGLYYLILRPNFIIDKLSIMPDEIVVDIFYGTKTNLIYSFYNPTAHKNITITASIKNDSLNVYNKIKANPTDIYLRQYFVRLALDKMNAVPPPNQSTPEIMTADQVANYLNVTVKTIRNWTSQRNIPSVKMGRSVRYRKTEIDDWTKNKKRRLKK